MKDILLDTLKDCILLLPFLFVAFLIIELIEHKLSDNGKKVIAKSGKLGPLFGSLLGVVPQCGFSVMATNLYVTRIVSLGTLISIYLSTSDEMLPILLVEKAPINTIVQIIVLKVLIGMTAGFIIDLIYRKKEQINYESCKNDHCECEGNIFKSAIIHTLNISVYILIITFIINIVLSYYGEEQISAFFLNGKLYAPFISSLIGLVPNCGASVMITELYVNNALSLGSAIAGLLTGSGVALIVLFKQNKNLKENLIILLLIYFIGSISGLIIELISRIL